ncbi:MAG: recombinase family protein [Butyrivibrio sp.]|nr:recombinase family protein [Butyrivibrio sp.]
MALRVAGYTKLAKLWERDRDEALRIQKELYEEKFKDDPDFNLAGVYVDITGNKNIYKRPEMVRLLRDCMVGEVDVIYAQTKGYLAANTREFCYLIKFLFDLKKHIDIVTEDDNYNINTGFDAENQRQELYQMADKFVKCEPEEYKAWLVEVSNAIKREG